MKEKTDKVIDDLLPEYDLDDFFKTGVRGKYAQRYKEGTNLVLLEPDVAKFFSDDKKVNETLRLVIEMTNMQDKISEVA